jgi:hypothetical protein
MMHEYKIGDQVIVRLPQTEPPFLEGKGPWSYGMVTEVEPHQIGVSWFRFAATKLMPQGEPMRCFRFFPLELVRPISPQQAVDERQRCADIVLNTRVQEWECEGVPKHPVHELRDCLAAVILGTATPARKDE